jgi:integrase
VQAKITKRTVDAAVVDAARDTWLWDSEIKGFGVRLRPNGRKTYIVEYRPGGGGRRAPKRRYTIGPHGSPWTPDTARAEARRILGLVAANRDPLAERSERRRRDANTVAEIAADFIEKYARRRQKSWRETKRVFLSDMNPAFGNKAIENVTRQDVVRLLDRVAERGPVMANRTLAYMRRFFNWCIERGYMEQNPCTGLRSFGEAVSRDRTLDDGELVEVWQAAEHVGSVWAPLIKLLILTAQRRSEVAEMRWSEIDFVRRTWTIPAERAKNKRAHDVPLADTALATLEAQPRLSFQDQVGSMVESPFVFTTTGKTPVSGFSKAKQILDRAILEARRESDPDAQAMPHWTFHDLRRTATTGMARLGIHPHIADAVLNHKEGTIRGVAAVYNRHAYLDERRRALEAWEAHLLGCIDGKSRTSQNVVDFVDKRIS